MKTSWNVLKLQLIDKISQLIDQQSNIEMVDQAVQTTDFEFIWSRWSKNSKMPRFNSLEGMNIVLLTLY